MKSLLFPVLIVTSALVLAAFSVARGRVLSGRRELARLTVGSCIFDVEITATPEDYARGLSGRASLPQNAGMFFPFDPPTQPGFWMKGMLIPLDFVWIRDGHVVEITGKVQVGDYQPPRTLKPSAPVDGVLELNAGAANRCALKVGDLVSF